MKDACILRGCILLFLASLAWFTLGSPVLTEEWQDIPHRLSLMLTQLPGRIVCILTFWR